MIRLPHFLVTLLLAGLHGWLAVESLAADDAAPPDYARDIAPLLTKYCIACHDADAMEGDLALDSYAALAKGGKHGPAVLAGDAAASRLYRLITRQAEPAMPPDDNPAPTVDEIAVFKAWIDAGAKGPMGAEPDRKTLRVPKLPAASVEPPVTALAWSPEGSRLAVGRYGVVQLFDPQTSQVVATLEGLSGKVSAVAFSRDGKWLATASGVPGAFGEARLWNLDSKKMERQFDGHRDLIYGLAISPTGEHLATCGYDRKTIVWDLQTGERRHTLEGHNDAIYDVVFSPDARLLATASGDATIKVWSLASGERLDTLGQPFKEQFCTSFSPGGDRIVGAGADNRLRVWRVVVGDKPAINPIEHTRIAHEGTIVKLAFSPDGKRLVTVGDDRTIKLWETNSFTQLPKAFPPQTDIVAAIAFSPDGDKLAVGRMDGSLELLTLPKLSSMPSLASAEPAAAPPVAVAGAADSQPGEPTKTAEVEPNDEPNCATPLSLPGMAEGVIHAAGAPQADDQSQADEEAAPSDVDLYRIRCRAGDTWVFETRAARDKSPLDTKLEVVDAAGQLVPRLKLAAVRDSYIHFRGVNSSERDVRMFGWEEMDIGQYFYFQGEVCKSFLMPRGPDSGMSMFPHGGSRFTYFDTTAMSHAMGEPCYVVEPLPLDVTPPPNGLPVFTIYFENDDDGLRRLGKDSRLTFTAPADGDYFVRVRDVRGFQGAAFKYTLSARRNQPDFTANVGGRDPSVAAGSGKTFNIDLDRQDGFEGEVRFDLVGAPPEGFTISTPIVVEKGLWQAKGVVSAARDAAQPSDEAWSALQFKATAEIEGRRVEKLIPAVGKVKLTERPKIAVQLAPVESQGGEEIVLEAGGSIPARLHLDRNGFDGRVTIDINNLPFGVIVANLGLNGLMIPAGESDWECTLEAAPWTPVTTCWIHATAQAEGNQSSPPIRLRIVRPTSKQSAEATAQANLP